MPLLRKYALALMLGFFFLLYHSNFREQGTWGDTLGIKLQNFALVDGLGLNVGPKMKEMAQGTGWAGKMGDQGRVDRPPYAMLPFLPLYAFYRWMGGPVTFFSVHFLAKLCAVAYALLSLLLLYEIALNLGASEGRALACVGMFGIATHLWDSVALGMWTTSAFVPFFSAGLMFLTRPRPSRADLALAAGFLGYAFACRNHDAVMALPFLAWMWLNHRKQAIAPLAIFGAFVALGLATNYAQNGSVLGTYGASQAAESARTTGGFNFGANPLVAIPAILFSPGRGLFAFAPFLILPFFWLKPVEWVRKTRSSIKARKLTLLDATVLACLLEILMVGKFSIWWGGYSWGPRILTSIIPAIFLLFVMTLPRKLPRVQAILLAAFVAWGIYVQGLGAYKYHQWVWNWRPTEIDSAPMRVWDFADTPFARAWNEPFYRTNWSEYSLEY